MMRGNRSKRLICDSSERLIGIAFGLNSLGNCRIAEVEQKFGVSGKVTPSGKLGDSRLITKTPHELRLRPNIEGHAYLIYNGTTDDKLALQLFKDSIRGHEVFDASWTGEGRFTSFGARIRNNEALGVLVLAQLHEAMMLSDAILFLSENDSECAGRGLNIAIRSRMPIEFMRQLEQKKLDEFAAAEATQGALISALIVSHGTAARRVAVH